MPARTELRDPIARLSFAFTQALEKAISDTGWARLVVQASKTPNEFGRSVRDNLMFCEGKPGGAGSKARALLCRRGRVRKREVRSAPFIRHFVELGRDISDMGVTGKRTSTDFAS